MKRIISAAMSAAMAICALSPMSASSGSLLFGDPNNDGKIDAKDASFVLEAYSKLSTGSEDVLTAEQSTAANVNRDDKFDAKDASAILAYYAYLSTGGTYTLEVYLGYKEPEKYEYRLENITKSADVFNYFADRMNYDIFRRRTYEGYTPEGLVYKTNGRKESRVALLLLNEDATYKSGVLSEVFKDYSNEDIRNGVWFFYNAPDVDFAVNGDIDFNNYTLDKVIGNFMNELRNICLKAIDTNDYTQFNELIDRMFNRGCYQKQYNNAASYYYAISLSILSCGYGNEDYLDCYAYVDEGDFLGVQELTENRVKEMIKQ